VAAGSGRIVWLGRGISALVTSVLGAILLTGYMGGAICTHLRVGDPIFVQAALGIFVWLGLYLLIPLRTPTT
jgi:DoxX-like protein